MEVVVVFLVFIVVHWGLLSSPGVVNLSTASAASALNNVVQVNLLQSILIWLKRLDSQNFPGERNGKVADVYLAQHSAQACYVSYLTMQTVMA